MMRYAQLFLFGLCAISLQAQTNIDTLAFEKELAEVKKIEGTSPEEAIRAYKKLEKEAASKKYFKGSLIASLNRAKTHHIQGEHETARFLADSVVKTANKHGLKKIEAEALRQKGRFSWRMGNFYTATEELIKAVKISQRISNKKITASCYNILGNVYFDLEDYAEAQKYYGMAISLYETGDDQRHYLMYRVNYANILAIQGKCEEALPLLDEISLELRERNDPNSLSLIGYVQGGRLECTPTEKHLLNDIYENLVYLEKNKEKLPNAQLDLAVLYMQFSEYQILVRNPGKALLYINKFAPLARKYGEETEKELLRIKSKYYELIGNKDSAIVFFKQYEEKRIESIKSKERAKTHELNLRYQTEKKDLELASKDLELQLLKEAAEKQRFHYIFIFGSAFVLVLCGLVIYLKNKNRILDKAKLAAIQAAKTKSLFLDVITHELRTPLSTIAGGIYLLRGERDPKLRENLLKGMEFSSEYLNKLIENTILLKTLEQSRPGEKERKEMEQRFNCRALIEGMGEALTHSKNNNRLEIYMDKRIPKYITGPELDLSRVLVNLVSNSNKFTRDGLIKIAVEKSMGGKDRLGLTFTVSDNGEGIREDEKERVFEAFYSGKEHTQEQYSGMGLGLNLVKNLLEKHGASPKLESVYGIGTSISFTLEFGVPSMIPEELERPAPRKKTDRDSVLLVEDNKTNQDITKRMIEELGYHCDVADNGKIALEKYKMTPYPIVLMDMMMPVMNGFEATESINKLNPNASVIALTAVSKEKYADVFKELNINTIIPKPVNIHSIREALENHLSLDPQAA